MAKRKSKPSGMQSLFPEWERAQKQLDREGFTPNHSAVYISFSGGKDSVACYILACQLYAKAKINLIFTDTLDEAPETYEYCAWFNANVHPITRLVTLENGRNNNGRILETHEVTWQDSIETLAETYLTVFDEITERHRSNPSVPPFPANGIRFCTQTLKVRAFGRWVRALYPDYKTRKEIVVGLGLRRAESDNRSDTPYFGFDLDNGWNLWYPVFDYTTAEIFELHIRHHIKINPIYQYRERSNCVGCPFSSSHEIAATVAKHGKQAISGWVALEQLTGYTWKNGVSIADLAEDTPRLVEAENCNSGYCEVI